MKKLGMTIPRFRAYDKYREEYLSGGNVFIGIPTGSRPKSNDIYLDIADDKYKNDYIDRFIIEQYTGFEDRNGTDMFEGDIVKRRFLNNKLEDEYRKFIIKKSKVCFCLYEYETGNFVRSLDGPEARECEIIGTTNKSKS